MEKNILVARGIFATGISVTLEHQVALILSQYSALRGSSQYVALILLTLSGVTLGNTGLVFFHINPVPTSLPDSFTFCRVLAYTRRELRLRSIEMAPDRCILRGQSQRQDISG
jgi:hypothetical protein